MAVTQHISLMLNQADQQHMPGRSVLQRVKGADVLLQLSCGCVGAMHSVALWRLLCSQNSTSAERCTLSDGWALGVIEQLFQLLHSVASFPACVITPGNAVCCWNTSKACGQCSPQMTGAFPQSGGIHGMINITIDIV